MWCVLHMGERGGVFRRLCVGARVRRVSLGRESSKGDLRGVLMYEFVMVAL